MIPIRGNAPRLRPPIVTLALVAANVAVFLHEVSLPPEALHALVHHAGVVPARFVDALLTDPLAVERWLLPLATAMFLHGGWGHLIGNMLFLWVFGDGLESRLGHGRFLAFYLACGVAASQGQIWSAPGSALPMIGASGAIAGVLGAYLVAFPRARIVLLVPILIFPLFFEVPAMLFLLVWVAEQLFAGTVGTLTGASGQGGVAWWAHVGGFVAGVLLLPLAGRPAPPTRRRRPPAARPW